MKRALIVPILFVLAIPTVGWIVSALISNSLEHKARSMIKNAVADMPDANAQRVTELLEDVNGLKICDSAQGQEAFNKLCDLASDIHTIAAWSVGTAIVGVLAIILIALSGKIAQRHRGLLLLFFRPGLFLAQLTVVFLVAANAGIAIASIYFAEAYFIERVHFYLIGVAGLAAGIVTLRVAGIALKPIRKPTARVFGKVLAPTEHPQLWSFVKIIAQRTGAQIPTHIVAGLEPTFFVTEANVLCLDGEIKGRTLFLSLPFCRVLETEELAAIIGHEMGHFVGKDTRYSRHFFPIYRGAIDTLALLDNEISDKEGGLKNLAILPAYSFITFFIYAFSEAENLISRERELQADSLGADISSKKDMASALVKVHAFGEVWSYTQGKMKEALANGQQLINASEYFGTIISLLPGDLFKSELAEMHTTHPTDSHPALKVRLDALGVSLEQFTDDKEKIKTQKPAITVVDNFEKLEKELTDVEHYKLAGQTKGISDILIDNSNPADLTAGDEVRCTACGKEFSFEGSHVCPWCKTEHKKQAA